MDIRRLTHDDADAISSLFKKLPRLFKNEQPQHIIQTTSDMLINSLRNRPDAVLSLGAFDENNQLTGTISGYRWLKMPFYTIRDLRSLNPEGNLRRYVEVFDGLLSRLLKEMENERRLDFYFINLQRNFHRHAFEKDGRQRDIPRYFTYVHRYELYIDEVIPPGSTSNYAAFLEMTFSKTFDVPVWIRRGSLKPELRNEIWRQNGL